MYKLYIVDDEQTVIDGLSTCITYEDYSIELCGSANDGITAYKQIIELKPDIVITDIRMPGLTGLELIDKVNLVCNDIRFIVFSGYSEFQHAKHALQSNAVDYLLKPISIEELKNSILKALELRKKEHLYKKHDQVLQEKFYYDAILNNSKIEYDTDKNDYLVICFRICNSSEKANPFVKLYNAHKGKTMLSLNTWVHLIKIFSDYVAIIESSSNISLLPLIANNNFIHNSYWFPNNDDIYFGISNTCKIHDISMAYQQAQKALNFAEFFSLPVVNYNQALSNDIDINLTEWILSLDTQLSQKSIDSISGILDQFFDKCKNINLSPINIKKLILDFIYHTVDIVEHDFTMSLNTLNKTNYLKEIELLTSLEDSKAYLISFYRAIVELISNKSIGMKAKIIKKIKNHVHNNLHRPISLDELADIIHKSPGYVSKLFKDETGSTVTQYITDEKIKKAKELLINSEYKIIDIAHTVGYEEERYFYQVFKKETGLTAKNYRKLHSISIEE